MKTSLPYRFVAAWISLVCYMSPLYLFSDAHLLPKWYLCIVGLAVSGILATMALYMIRGSRLQMYIYNLMVVQYLVDFFSMLRESILHIVVRTFIVRLSFLIIYICK